MVRFVPAKSGCHLFSHCFHEFLVQIPCLHRTKRDAAHTADAFFLISVFRIAYIDSTYRTFFCTAPAGNAIVVSFRLEGNAVIDFVCIVISGKLQLVSFGTGEFFIDLFCKIDKLRAVFCVRASRAKLTENRMFRHGCNTGNTYEAKLIQNILQLCKGVIPVSVTVYAIENSLCPVSCDLFQALKIDAWNPAAIRGDRYKAYVV